MIDEPEIDETPEVIAKAQAIIQNLTPATPCSGWPCSEIEKACVEIARLELKIQDLQTELKCLKATMRM